MTRKTSIAGDDKRLDWCCQEAGLPLHEHRKHAIFAEWWPAEFVREIIDAAIRSGSAMINTYEEVCQDSKR